MGADGLRLDILKFPPENILLIQLGDIGDVVLTSPTVRAIKETLPGSRVSILVFKPYGSLLGADPNLYEVVETARVRGPLLGRLRDFVAFAKELRKKRYDCVIDLRTGDRGAILALLSGAPVRIGRRGVKKQFWHKHCFTTTLGDLKIAPPPVHPGADQSLRVVRELGIDTSDSTPRLYIEAKTAEAAAALLADMGIAAGQRYVTINPYSRWKYKEWDDTKWGEVIDHIWRTHHLPILLIGSKEEAGRCQGIASGRERYTFNLAGKTTLAELAAVISASSLQLGVDSAAPHIAAALGTPTITIHGPTDWRAWRIVDEHNLIVSLEKECLPCRSTGCDNTGQSDCLVQLPVEPVVIAVEKILLDSHNE